MAILEEEIIFGIVLYNEKISTSDTFLSLIESIKSYNTNNKVNIIVFDNSPNNDNNSHEIIRYTDNITVYYFTENVNKGLPYAYNLFASKAKEMNKNWLVLLDQDTTLPTNFYSSYLDIDSDSSVVLYCSLVFSNNELMSPAYYKNFRSYKMPLPNGDKLDLKDVSCINSGLMINVNYFLEVGGYNKELFLDFCDHDFIYKLKANQLKTLGIISCQLVQDFSSNNHTKDQALSRYRLFVRDLKAFYKNKNLLQIFIRVDLPRLLKLTYQYKSLQFLKIRFI